MLQEKKTGDKITASEWNEVASVCKRSVGAVSGAASIVSRTYRCINSTDTRYERGEFVELEFYDPGQENAWVNPDYNAIGNPCLKIVPETHIPGALIGALENGVDPGEVATVQIDGYIHPGL